MATVELKTNLYWKRWSYFGVVPSLEKAESLIKDGWPDGWGIPTQDINEPYTFEVVRWEDVT